MKTEPTPKIAAALVKAQRNAKAVEKSATNQFMRYKYASAESMISEARDSMTECGLALVSTGWRVEPGTPERPWCRVLVSYRLYHDSGELLDFDPVETAVLPEKGRPQDKAEATALTYNLGYFLRALLQLPRVEEGANADGRDDRDHEPRNGKQPETPRQPLPTPPAPKLDSAATLQKVIAAVKAAPDRVTLKAYQAGYRRAEKGLSPLQLQEADTLVNCRLSELGLLTDSLRNDLERAIVEAAIPEVDFWKYFNCTGYDDFKLPDFKEAMRKLGELKAKRELSVAEPGKAAAEPAIKL